MKIEDIFGLLESKEKSFKDSIEEHQVKILDNAKTSKAICDSYGNPVLSIGNDDVIAKFDEYSLTNNTLNWSLWLALYNDSWVFKRAIDKPASDEIRCGISLQGVVDKKNVLTTLNRHREDFIELLCWGALFGGAISVLMFDNMNDEDYAKPMNLEKLRSHKTLRFYTTDRWYGISPSMELVTDMSSLDYGKPKYYYVTFADGHQMKVHHDYILRYEHRKAPRLIKNGMLQGWGYAEGSHILNEMMRDEKLKASIQSLVDKALIEVIKMPGMRGIFLGADNENEEQIQKRLEMVTWSRNNNSITLLDKEDEYSQNTFGGLTGLSDILQQNMWMIAAALEMQGVLFGDLKSGFANDTDALRRYDETINNRCESFLRPIYTKFLTILYKYYKIEEPVAFTFNSLLNKENNKDKMEGLRDLIDTCQKLLDAGVIDISDFGMTVQKYANDGTLDFGLTNEKIDQLKEKMKEENEMFDLSEVKK